MMWWIDLARGWEGGLRGVGLWIQRLATWMHEGILVSFGGPQAQDTHDDSQGGIESVVRIPSFVFGRAAPPSPVIGTWKMKPQPATSAKLR